MQRYTVTLVTAEKVLHKNLMVATLCTQPLFRCTEHTRVRKFSLACQGHGCLPKESGQLKPIKLLKAV